MTDKIVIDTSKGFSDLRPSSYSKIAKTNREKSGLSNSTEKVIVSKDDNLNLIKQSNEKVIKERQEQAKKEKVAEQKRIMKEFQLRRQNEKITAQNKIVVSGRIVSSEALKGESPMSLREDVSYEVYNNPLDRTLRKKEFLKENRISLTSVDTEERAGALKRKSNNKIYNNPDLVDAKKIVYRDDGQINYIVNKYGNKVYYFYTSEGDYKERFFVSQYQDVDTPERTGTNKRTNFEKRIDYVSNWEDKLKNRGDVYNWFQNKVEESPFRNYVLTNFKGSGGRTVPLSETEKTPLRLASVPSNMVIKYPEYAIVNSLKGGLLFEGYFNPNPETRFLVKQEDSKTRGLTESAFPLGVVSVGYETLKSMNPQTAEGRGTIFEFATAGSIGKKLISLAKEPYYFGKTEIPIQTVVEGKVLSGKIKFPKSNSDAKALADMFNTGDVTVKFKTLVGINKPVRTVKPYNRMVFKETRGINDIPPRTQIRSDTLALVKQDVKGYTTKETFGGFTASPSKIFTSKGVLAGTSATKGMYIADTLSAYFLKIGNEGSRYSFSLLPSFRTPSANFIKTQGEVGTIPKEYLSRAETLSGIKGLVKGGGKENVAGSSKPQRRVAISELNKYWEDVLSKSGKGSVSPEYYVGKGEREAIIGEGSGLKTLGPKYNTWDKLTDFKYYTTYKGEKVPFRILEATPKARTGIAKVETELNKNIIESSSRRLTEKKYPLISSVSNKLRVESYPSTVNNQGFSSSYGTGSRSGAYPLSSSIRRTGEAYEYIPPSSSGGSGSLSRRSSYERYGTNLTDTSGIGSSKGGGSSSSSPYEPYTPTPEPYRPPENPYRPPERPRYNPPVRPISNIFESKPQGNIYPSSKNKNILGFDVFVKEKGLFKKVNVDAYSKGQALTFGAGYVQTTPSATFKIKPSNSPAKPLKTYLGSGLSGFYSKGEVLIEKNKERINTIGELRGITFKGIDARRNSSKLKKLYGR